MALGWILGTSTSLFASQDFLNEFDSMALQGDVKAGLAILERIQLDSLSASDRDRCQCLLSRFRNRTLPNLELSNPLARDTADIYLKYWRRCLLQEVKVMAANAQLLEDLKACLTDHGKAQNSFSSLDELTDALGPILLADGVHSLRGVTA